MWPTNKKHWMLTRHTRLTKAQEERLPVVCEKWRQIALCTEPSDRKKAQQAVFEIYRAAGAKTRPKVVWLNTSLDYSDRLVQSLSRKVNRRYRLEIRRDDAHLGAARYYKESLVNSVEDTIARIVPRLPPTISFNSIWSPGVNGYSFAREFALMDFFDTPRHQQFKPYLEAARSCHSYILFEHAVVFFERPKEIHVDAQGRLHNYDAPAMVYRYNKPNRIIYRASFHGVTVDRKWLDTPADQIELADILIEENAQIRAALLAKYGLDRMLKNVKHKTISKMKGNALLEFVVPGRKWESKEKPRIATLRMRVLHLKWKDKTGERETLLPVPRLQSQFGADRPANCDSAEQVRRWTLGWSKEALAVAET